MPNVLSLFKYTDRIGKNMEIIIAAEGEFLETLKQHVEGNAIVLPFGADWRPVTESGHVFEALLQRPLTRRPIPILESFGTVPQ